MRQLCLCSMFSHCARLISSCTYSSAWTEKVNIKASLCSTLLFLRECLMEQAASISFNCCKYQAWLMNNNNALWLDTSNGKSRVIPPKRQRLHRLTRYAKMQSNFYAWGNCIKNPKKSTSNILRYRRPQLLLSPL
jgi:hypothetical protein